LKKDEAKKPEEPTKKKENNKGMGEIKIPLDI